MTMFFSPSTKGFHDETLGPLPSDAVAISADRHRSLLAGQQRGLRIVSDKYGKPALQAQHKPDLAARRANVVASIKAEAALRIEAVSPIWRQLNDLRLGTMSIEPVSLAALDRFAEIDRLRAVSDAMEAATMAMTAEQLARFRPDADHHWTVQETTL